MRTSSAQDITFEVSFFYDDKDVDKEQKGTIKIQNVYGVPTFFFYRQLGNQPAKMTPQQRRASSQLPDCVNPLSDFTIIESNFSNKNLLYLIGNNINYKILFNNDEDKRQFLNFIGQRLIISHSYDNPYIFYVKPAYDELSSYNVTSLPRGEHDLTNSKIVLSSLNKLESKAPEISTVTFSDLSLNEEGTLKEPYELYNRIIKPEDIGKVWTLLYIPDEKANIELYNNLKIQWSTVSLIQWTNHTALRDLVRRVEDDLNKNSEYFKKYNNPKQIQKHCFNVLVSNSIYNWDGAEYFDGQFIFLLPFIDAYLDKGDELEAYAFGCFSQFYIKNDFAYLLKPTNFSYIAPILENAGKIIDEKLFDLLNFLFQKHCFSLDFFSGDIRNWFVRVFKDEELARLWISISVFGNKETFFSLFVISILHQLSPELDKITPLDDGEFIEAFNSLKQTLNVSTLLENVQRLNAMIS